MNMQVGCQGENIRFRYWYIHGKLLEKESDTKVHTRTIFDPYFLFVCSVYGSAGRVCLATEPIPGHRMKRK